MLRLPVTKELAPVSASRGEQQALKIAEILPGNIPPEASPRLIPVDNLEHIVRKILMKELSNNWSLEAYREKIENAVKRTHDNKETIAGVAQTIAEVGAAMAGMQRKIAGLGDQATGQDTVAGKLRQDLSTLTEGHNRLVHQVTDLFNLTAKQTEEINCLEGEVKRMGVENTTRWNKHEVDHGSIIARLSALEELRRLDNLNRGQENTAELNNAFMAGFQRCLEVQIANGTFPRRLLSNKAFMDMVKDKDGLLIKISEKDSQEYWRGEPSQQPE